MAESLFTRLVSYSQNPNKRSIENFLTEVLAHLVNTDPAFRQKFVELVIPKHRIRRGFGYAFALPQQTLGRGIVDLVLEGSCKVFVEVKVGARETETKIYGHGWVLQVQKYLSYRSGYVAYLTTREVPSPTVNSKFFLGHFLLEDLHGRLNRNRLSPTGLLLLDFMEENDMKALEPFTKTDLYNATHSFNFIQKCQSVLEEVAGELEPKVRTIFHKRTGFMSAHFSPRYKVAYSAVRNFSYRDAYELCLFLEPWEAEVGFGVSACVAKESIVT